MGLIEVEPGVTLFVQDEGVGPVVVLVPGFGLDHTVWERQVRAMTPDHRVICVDQRGHGASDKPEGGYTVDRLARDLLAVVEELDLRDLTLVGWSFGGQVALQLCAIAPERVARLVLLCSNGVRSSRTPEFPFGPPGDRAEAALVSAELADRVPARRAAISSGFASEPEADLVDRLLDISLKMPTHAAIACYHAMLSADLTSALPAVLVPVLQLMGSDDPVHVIGGARWVNERLADARLVEIPGCGHYPMFEAPEAFDAALLAFVG